MTNILKCRNICKNVNNGTKSEAILKNVSLDIKTGEFVSIMGASGAGKSTLLYILGLMDQPNAGELYLDSQSILDVSENELCNIRRDEMGFVFQSYNLVTSLTALDNILLPAYIKSNKKLKKKKYEEAKVMIERLGLKDKSNYRVNKLSGGEQQRIAIGRALINSPKIVFMDEPTGNLDSKNAIAIMKLIKTFNETENMTFLQVTHSIEFANYGDRILHMQDGEIVDETLLDEKGLLV